MSLVNFKQGTKSSIDETPESEGTIYFTTDTKEIIVDLPGGKRTSYGKLPDFEIPDKSITLNKLSDEVGTVAVGPVQPQDEHVLLWIDYSE